MTCRFPEQINLSASHSFLPGFGLSWTFLQKNDGQYRVRPVPKIHGPSWPVPNFALSGRETHHVFIENFPGIFGLMLIINTYYCYLSFSCNARWKFAGDFCQAFWKINTEAKAKVSAQRRGPRPCERPRASSWGWSVVHPSLPVC